MSDQDYEQDKEVRHRRHNFIRNTIKTTFGFVDSRTPSTVHTSSAPGPVVWVSPDPLEENESRALGVTTPVPVSLGVRAHDPVVVRALRPGGR